VNTTQEGGTYLSKKLSRLASWNLLLFNTKCSRLSPRTRSAIHSWWPKNLCKLVKIFVRIVLFQKWFLNIC